MALPGSGIVNQGLQRIGANASGIASGTSTPSADNTTVSPGSTYSATRYIMTMSIDDAAGITSGHTNFQAADTTLRNAGSAGPTNEADQLLDASPTRSSQTISYLCTYATGTGNFTIVRIALHDDTATNTTTTSTTLVGGISGQSITKTSSFSLAITLAILFSDNSP